MRGPDDGVTEDQQEIQWLDWGKAQVDSDMRVLSFSSGTYWLLRAKLDITQQNVACHQKAHSNNYSVSENEYR